MMQKLKSCTDVPSTRWMERVLRMTRTDGIFKKCGGYFAVFNPILGLSPAVLEGPTDRQKKRLTDR